MVEHQRGGDDRLEVIYRVTEQSQMLHDTMIHDTPSTNKSRKPQQCKKNNKKKNQQSCFSPTGGSLKTEQRRHRLVDSHICSENNGQHRGSLQFVYLVQTLTISTQEQWLSLPSTYLESVQKEDEDPTASNGFKTRRLSCTLFKGPYQCFFLVGFGTFSLYNEASFIRMLFAMTCQWLILIYNDFF